MIISTSDKPLTMEAHSEQEQCDVELPREEMRMRSGAGEATRMRGKECRMPVSIMT